MSNITIQTKTGKKDFTEARITQTSGLYTVITKYKNNNTIEVLEKNYIKNSEILSIEETNI